LSVRLLRVGCWSPSPSYVGGAPTWGPRPMRSTMQPREVAKASEVFVVDLACGEGLFESVPLHPVDHPGLQSARPRMPDVADGDRDAVKLIGRFLGGVDPPGFVPFNNHITVDADVVNRRRQEVRTTIVVDQIAGQHQDGPTARCEVERADVGEDRFGAFHVSEVGQHLGVVVDARDLVIERKEVAVTRPVPQPSSRIGEPGGTAAWDERGFLMPGQPHSELVWMFLESGGCNLRSDVGTFEGDKLR
jgi:hypothetical protein